MDREQSLVLLRRQSDLAGRSLAEAQKLAYRNAACTTYTSLDFVQARRRCTAISHSSSKRLPVRIERRGSPRRSDASDQRPYAHFGSPSLLAGASAVEPTYTEQVFVVVVCVTLAVNPSAVTVMVGPTTPVVVAYAVPRLLVYFTESAKYASSAVIRLRRSDFIDAR